MVKLGARHDHITKTFGCTRGAITRLMGRICNFKLQTTDGCGRPRLNTPNSRPSPSGIRARRSKRGVTLT